MFRKFINYKENTNMCHGSNKSATIRFKGGEHHKNAKPYKREKKHKGRFVEDDCE